MPTRYFPGISRLHRANSSTVIVTLAALAAFLFAGAFIAAPPALAQQGFGNFYTYQPIQKKRTAKKRTTPRAVEATPASKPQATDAPAKTAEKSGPAQPVSIVVSLRDQHASIYDANGFVTRTRVSTGQAGHRTPSGVFSVIGKKRWHRSNIYSGAPMPYMQRITWSGVALHAGVVPGYPASHGCIRLPAKFAPQLFGMTNMGARVIVTPTDVQPVTFSHPLLPAPKMQPTLAMPATPNQQAAANGSVELASIDTSARDSASPSDPSEPAKLLNPIAFAAALKRRAAAERSAADLAATSALAAAQAAGVEARQAAEAIRKAEADLKAAEAKLSAIDTRASASGATVQPAAAGAAPMDRSAAEADLASARAALAQAEEHEAAKSAAAFDAVESWKRAADAAKAASDLVEEADRRREQVSVLISRKEGRIFIRQSWKEVWEAPVTIRDPDRPIGTHVYTAVEPTADGSSMRWTAITMPASTPASEKRRGRDKDKPESAEAPPVVAPETASGALDRIELPEGARERIAELLWTGGSLIVTDEPRSWEMSENATDFIVLTR